MTTTCTRRIKWDAAHRVMRHESKCKTLHGHEYVALVTCEAAELDFAGRVVDFGVVKERVGQWVDTHWDHTTIVNKDDVRLLMFAMAEYEDHGHRRPYALPGEPTAENLARHLQQVAADLLADTGVRVVKVEVYETENCSATETV